MLGVETVVAEQFLLLLVIFRVDEGRVAVGADEALAVPAALSIKHEILHMNWQLTTFAYLSNRLSLQIILPETIIIIIFEFVGVEKVLHFIFDALFTLQTIVRHQELSFLVSQEEVAGDALEALLVILNISEHDSLGNCLMTHMTRVKKLLIITLTTQRLAAETVSRS